MENERDDEVTARLNGESALFAPEDAQTREDANRNNPLPRDDRSSGTEELTNLAPQAVGQEPRANEGRPRAPEEGLSSSLGKRGQLDDEGPGQVKRQRTEDSHAAGAGPRVPAGSSQDRLRARTPAGRAARSNADGRLYAELTAKVDAIMQAEASKSNITLSEEVKPVNNPEDPRNAAVDSFVAVPENHQFTFEASTLPTNVTRTTKAVESNRGSEDREQVSARSGLRSTTREPVALIPDTRTNYQTGRVDYLTPEQFKERYDEVPSAATLDSDHTMIKARDGSVVTKAHYYSTSVIQPDKVRGLTEEEVIRRDFDHMGLDMGRISENAAHLTDHKVMVNDKGVHALVDPKNEGFNTLQEAKEKFGEVWVKTEKGQLRTSDMFDKTYGRNAAARRYGEVSGVPFAERRNDIAVALYRVGKEYVSEEAYEELRTGEKPPSGMERDKARREVLLQSPDGGSVLTPFAYKRAHPTTFLPTMRANGLDWTMGDKLPTPDKKRPQTLVPFEGKLVDGRKFLKDKPGQSLIHQLGKNNVFVQRVDKSGRLTGSFDDMGTTIIRAKDKRENTSRLNELGVTKGLFEKKPVAAKRGMKKSNARPADSKRLSQPARQSPGTTGSSTPLKASNSPHVNVQISTGGMSPGYKPKFYEPRSNVRGR